MTDRDRSDGPELCGDTKTFANSSFMIELSEKTPGETQPVRSQQHVLDRSATIHPPIRDRPGFGSNAQACSGLVRLGIPRNVSCRVDIWEQQHGRVEKARPREPPSAFARKCCVPVVGYASLGQDEKLEGPCVSSARGIKRSRDHRIDQFGRNRFAPIATNHPATRDHVEHVA